jgi:hypothetical protein
MNRMIARSRNEDGAILLIALGFLAFIGVVAAALMSYATTNIRETSTLRDIRNREYAANGVVDTAINKIRLSYSGVSNIPNCLAPLTPPINGVSLRVDCQDSAGTGVDVTFTACLASAPLAPCPANLSRLVARVQYNRSVTPAAVTIKAWSVQR